MSWGSKDIEGWSSLVWVQRTLLRLNEPFKGFKSGAGTKSEGSGDYGGWNQRVEIRGQ